MSKEKFEALTKAQSNLSVSLCHFNYAEPDYIDKVIENLNAALNDLNMIRANMGMKEFVL